MPILVRSRDSFQWSVFLSELQRRHILRVTAVYMAGGWILVQVASTTFPLLGLPSWAPSLVLALALLGLPLALALAWVLAAAPEAITVAPAPTFPRTLPQHELTVPHSRRTKTSILVLPFANVSSDRENEYFSDGLTEEVIADLSKIRALRVISRTTAMRLKASEKGVSDIAHELEVDYVLEGSVRKARDGLRITAQLIEAREDAPIWTERYTGRPDELFEIQERVAREIARALRVQLSPEEDLALAERPISDLRAYECYLRARYEYAQFTEDAVQRALALLRHGLEIVGENGLLYAAMGYAYFSYGSAVVGVHEEYLTGAEECARKILELEPDSAQGHGLMGIVLFDRFQTTEGLRHMRRAVLLNPSDLDARTWGAMCFAMCGETDLAEEWTRELEQVDPLSPFVHWVSAWVQLMTGRFESALKSIETAYRLDDAPLFRTAYAETLGFLGQIQEACEVLDGLSAASSRENWAVLGRVLRHALVGDREKALSFITPELRDDARTDMLYSWLLAEYHALLGMDAEALEWLRNAIRGGFLNHRFLAELDPYLVSLRGHPEFVSLIRHASEEWRGIRPSILA